MTVYLLLVAFVIVAGILLNRVSDKAGVPILLVFILMGMAFGSDGIWKIEFDNFEFAEKICSVALIFIMFYGGFGTNWKQAKPVAVRAGILATVGVMLTAAAVGGFCYLVLKMDLFASMLLGSVISSTDAASVFSILRSKNLGLKYNTASLLELESGSNDPSSYMMTSIVLTMMTTGISAGSVAYMLFAQFAFGILVSIVIARFGIYMLKKFPFGTDGFDTVFVIAVALLAYALADYIGGNGYLSVYLVGIVMGNTKIKNKKNLVAFFDGVTGLMQMMLFFLLGLLSFPSQLPVVAGVSFAIALFLTFIARPLVIFVLLTPFRCPWQQSALVSFAGLRGAASIVFAIMATVSGVVIKEDVFHIVFFIVLFSIALQGSLIPWASRKLNMIDADLDVRKTFTDYVDEVPVQFVELPVGWEHPWIDKEVSGLSLPPDMLIVVIIRNRETLIPAGNTVIQSGDRIVISAPAFKDNHGVQLTEKTIDWESGWVGKSIAEYSKDPEELVVLIRRGSSSVIPRGDTVLINQDVLVIHSQS